MDATLLCDEPILDRVDACRFSGSDRAAVRATPGAVSTGTLLLVLVCAGTTAIDLGLSARCVGFALSAVSFQFPDGVLAELVRAWLRTIDAAFSDCNGTPGLLSDCVRLNPIELGGFILLSSGRGEYADPAVLGVVSC